MKSKTKNTDDRKPSSDGFNGLKIVALGAGESGIGTAILAKKKGYNIFVSDS